MIGTDSLPGAPCATVHTEVGGANARHDRGVLRLVSSDAGASIIRLDSGA
ncbi:hypothetical protein ACTXKZ_06660 [Brachybacterium alimentarium]